jgi:glycosyltransferase involved in cell wall biosynthesis
MSASGPLRLAYLATHPIQYQAPLLRLVAAEPGIEFKAFFRSPMGLKQYVDPGFGRAITWDVPLLEGYAHEFLPALGDPLRVTPFLRPFSYGLSRRLAEGRFDVLWVHGYARVFHQAAMLAAKTRGLKILLRDEPTAISKPRGAVKRVLRRAAFAGLARLVDGVLSIGRLNRQYWIDQGFSPAQVYSMPYAVDNARFRAGAEAAAMKRAQFLAGLGLPVDRPRIVFSGKLTPIKAPEVLLEAFARLDGPKASLVLVGDGPLRGPLEARARALGVAERVCFAGFRNQLELPAFYDAADVFVLPSRQEPWGLVVNEAMNAGRAVIVSNKVGSGADLVRPGENGAVVPAGDAAALAAALADVLASPERSAAMGRSSLEIIERWSFREDIAGLRQALAGIGFPAFGRALEG